MQWVFSLAVLGALSVADVELGGTGHSQFGSRSSSGAEISRSQYSGFRVADVAQSSIGRVPLTAGANTTIHILRHLRRVTQSSDERNLVQLGSQTADTVRDAFLQHAASESAKAYLLWVSKAWTPQDLWSTTTWLYGQGYFSLFAAPCTGDVLANSVTYLPISGQEALLDAEWPQIALPQEVLILDMRDSHVFNVVALGDAECTKLLSGTQARDAQDSSETDFAPPDDSCIRKSTSAECKAPGAAESTSAVGAPEDLWVPVSEPRAARLEWQAAQWISGEQPMRYHIHVSQHTPGMNQVQDRHETVQHVSHAVVQTHLLTSLSPYTTYSISVRSESAAAELGPATTLIHHTEAESLWGLAAFDLRRNLHCGLSPAEEVWPAGPPPKGASFFRNTTTPEECEAACERAREQCMTYQVKHGEACWLYRRRPYPGRLESDFVDHGWWCGIRRE